MGPDDPFFENATRFLNEAKAGRTRLVISSLPVSEAADVIRRSIKAGCRCANESGRERKAVDAKAAAAVKDLVRFIDILKASKITDVLEDIAEAQPDLVRLHQKLLGDHGHTPQARRGGTYRHEGIGPIDWIRIALARLAGAQAICTSDGTLAQIGGDEEYGCPETIVLRPR